MAQNVDVTNQTPAGGGVNKPASGTYGEQAALDNLKSALPPVPSPSSGGGGPGPLIPMPTPSGGTPQKPATGAGELPSALLAPTSMPDVAPSTPLISDVRPPVPPMSARQKRLALLDALANSPEVSDETREWAVTVRQLVVNGSRR